MSNALRRRLAALKEMRVDRGATPGEADAARAAIARIGARLAALGMEEQAERAEPVQPQRRRRRDKRPKPRGRLHVGDVLDATGVAPFTYCRCGSSRFQVEEGTPPVAVAWLRCTGCSRARKLSRQDFMPGGAAHES